MSAIALIHADKSRRRPVPCYSCGTGPCSRLDSSRPSASGRSIYSRILDAGFRRLRYGQFPGTQCVIHRSRSMLPRHRQQKPVGAARVVGSAPWPRSLLDVEAGSLDARAWLPRGRGSIFPLPFSFVPRGAWRGRRDCRQGPSRGFRGSTCEQQPAVSRGFFGSIPAFWLCEAQPLPACRPLAFLISTFKSSR